MSILAHGVVALAVLCPVVFAGVTPQLTVNGVTSADNTAVPHLTKLSALSIEITGTPHAPFAVLLSADANDGTGGEPNVLNGFFLEPFVAPPVLDLPIHPVFDGIGMEFIRQKLNQQGQSLAPDDVVNDVPAPVFRFDATGKFSLTGVVPGSAFLVNLTPNPPAFPSPLPIDLESQTGGAVVALYLQVVELHVPSLNVVVGNGMKVVFDPVAFAGRVAYAEGTDTVPTSSVVTNRLTISSFDDSNLADATTVAPSPDPQFAGINGALDFWLIGLAGAQPLYSASNYPNSINGGSGDPADPNAASTIDALQNQASGIEAYSGRAPCRNNENREFPYLALPGHRRLYHWCNTAALPSPTFGFAIFFEDTATWRNLTPSPFSFDNTATISPWEYEVGVSPDGDRAIVVLDRAIETRDRLFMLNLEPGGSFSSGLPIFEFVPVDPSTFTRVFEETIEFLADGAGSWVAFFCATDEGGTLPSTYPKRMFRANLADSGAAHAVVIPSGAAGGVIRTDRQGFVSSDRTKLCIVAGSSPATENVFCITNVTLGGQSILNLTGSFIQFLTIGESNDATDGNLGVASFSPDGNWFAFARENNQQRLPRVCKTDASTASLTVDLIKDKSIGGPFDVVNDYPTGRDYHFAKDSMHLLFQQGLSFPGAQLDRFDLFSTQHATKVSRNLTRTGKNGSAPMTTFGPWDPPSTGFDLGVIRSNLDPCGAFKSANGDFLHFFRELRGLPSAGFDRQNLIAVSIAIDPGLGAPSFEVQNVTGTEFPLAEGEPVPPFGAPDMHAGGSSDVDSFPEYHRARRLGGSGPFKDFIVMTGRIGNAAPGQQDIDQLFFFDPENPGPAALLTSFSTSPASPMPVLASMRISNVTPSPSESKILLVVDADGPSGQPGSLQDLVLLDFGAFALPQRIPATAAPFSRIIASGSPAFFPSSPSGILFVAGTRPRPAGLTDGVGVAVDAGNPTDASPFFYRTVAPAAVAQLQPLTTAARAAMIFGIREN